MGNPGESVFAWVVLVLGSGGFGEGGITCMFVMVGAANSFCLGCNTATHAQAGPGYKTSNGSIL